MVPQTKKKIWYLPDGTTSEVYQPGAMSDPRDVGGLTTEESAQLFTEQQEAKRQERLAKLQQTPVAKPSKYRLLSPELEASINTVYSGGLGPLTPQNQDLMIQTLTKAEQDPDNFLMDLQVRGKTPETVQLLKAFAAEPLDDDVVNSFFANQTLTPFQQSLLKSLPNTVRLPSGAGKGTIEWATKYYTDNPDKLRRDLITAGRNENSEALVRQLFPMASDRAITDYFNVDSKKWQGLKEIPKGRPQINQAAILSLSGKPPIKEPWERVTAWITTPKGNKVRYPMTPDEWSRMTPAERLFYEAKPDEWLKDREEWARDRVANDRIKIIAETLGITPGSLDSPAEQWRLTYEVALWLPIFDIARVGKTGYGIVKQVVPKSAKEFLTATEQILSKIARTDVSALIKGSKGKLTKEAAERIKAVAQKAIDDADQIKPEPVKFTKEGDIIPPSPPEGFNMADEQLKVRQAEALKAGGQIEKINPGEFRATKPNGSFQVFRDADSAGEFVTGAPQFKPVSAGGQGGVTPPAAPPPAKPGFAANIRLEKFNEDVQPLIKDWADAHPAEVQAARRGVRSDAQVRMDAERLMTETGGDLDKLRAEWKAGQVWNDAETTAIRGVLSQKSAEVSRLTAIANTNASAENLLNLELAIREQGAVQEIVHGVAAELGRGLRSFRQSFNEALASGTATREAKMEALLKKIGGKANSKKVAELLAKLDIDDPVAVNAFIRNLSKPGAMDYINELYYFSLLSGPKSWIVNALSTTFNTLTSPVRRMGAAIVEVPLAAVQRRARKRFFGEVPADIIGAVQGIPEGFRQFAHVMKNGISIEQATKWEIRPRAFGNKTSATLGFGPRIMEATDQLIMAWNMRAATNVEAYRMASLAKNKAIPVIERMADILADPPIELIARAKVTAERNLFRAEPGKFTKALMNFRESVSFHGIQPLRFVFPFIKTPVNLAKFGLENSPVGFFNPKLLGNLRAKNAQAADQVAEAILGTMGVAGIAWYAASGKITGQPPRNPAERERFYREGKQPFAIRIGDVWVSYQRLEPFNQLFMQAALIVDAIQNQDKNVQELITNAATTFVRNFVSQGYMSSISDAIDALEEPERYGQNWLNRFATAAIPWSAALRTAAQIIDPTVRAPENVIESIMANIPGLSKRVQAKLTTMGEEVKRKSQAWFPVSVTPVEETILSQELERLKYDIGFAGTSIDGFKLSDKEQIEYQTLSGQYIKTDLEKLMLAPDYWQATDVEREKMIRKVTDKARERARDKLKEKMFSQGTTEERLVTISTAVKTADSQLGKVLSATPEFSHEPPNVYDLAHELDVSYTALLDGIPESAVKDAPPTVKSWYAAHRVLDTTSILPNKSLSQLNADPKDGDTYEDYFNQWQQRMLITDEKELAEYDKVHPNVKYGNFSRRQLEDLRKFHSLTGVEQRDFLNQNPGLLANPKRDWLTSHPKENALLALWGEEKLLTKEAYDAYNKLVQELDIVDSALPPDVIPENLSVFELTTEKAFRETTAKIEAARHLKDEKLRDEEIKKLKQTKIGDMTYVDIERKVEALKLEADDNTVNLWIERGQITDELSPNSAEAKLFLVDNPDLHKWALENGLLTDDGQDWNIPVLRINAQYRDEDKAYDALPTTGTDRADYLKNNPLYADARIRRTGYEYGFDEAMVNKWSEYNRLPSYGFWKERYRAENPDFEQATKGAMGKDAWMPLEPAKIPNQAYDEIYEKYKDLFDQYEGAQGTDSERSAFRKNLFAQNPAFKEGYYARAGYKLLLQDKNVQDYVTYMLMPEKGWAKERFLVAHPEFFKDIQKRKEETDKSPWMRDIKWNEIPSEKVEALYFEYLALPEVTKTRQEFRAANPDLDDWLVLTKKVSKSIKETKRVLSLSPRDKFIEELSKSQTDFEKSIDALRKRMGGL